MLLTVAAVVLECTLLSSAARGSLRESTRRTASPSRVQSEYGVFSREGNHKKFFFFFFFFKILV